MSLLIPPPDWNQSPNQSLSPRDWLRIIGGILVMAGLISFAVSASGNIYAFLVGLFLVPFGTIIFVSNNNRDAQRNLMRVYRTFLRWLRDVSR